MQQQEIIRLEELANNAFPALYTELYDGWILRFSEGFTYRGNCVSPLYPSAISLETKLNHCEQKYFDAGLPCIFKLFATSTLDTFLSQHGYILESTVDVMTLPLPYHSSTNGMVELDYELSSGWIEDFLDLNGTTSERQQSTAASMLYAIRNPVLCASIIQDGCMVACGLGVQEDHYLGLFDIRVLPAYRRRGYATEICQALLCQGGQQGISYLQVDSSNTAGKALYTKLGFQTAYSYWYRVKH